MRKKLFYFLITVHLVIIFYFWWITSGHLIGTTIANTYLSFGRIAGLIGASLILFQFILIGRTQFIEEVFGFDRMTKVHRLNGKVALCVILVHPVLLLLGYSISSGVSLLQQEIQFLTQFTDVLQASIGLAILCITVFLSIKIVSKNLKYEWWYGIHVFNYLALFLVFGHQYQLGADFQASKVFTIYWITLYTLIFFNFVIFRILHQLYLYWKYQFRVAAITKESDSVTSVTIEGKNLPKLQRMAGQFFLYRFLDNRLWWQEHPFSVSNGEKDTIRLSAKAVGDFTRALPTIRVGTRVIIDGPFGVFRSDKAKKKKFLLIAGGIGITPIRSLFEELSKKKIDTILLYSCSTQKEIIFQKELDHLVKMYRTTVIYIMTRDQAFNGEKGRVDKEKLQRLVPDIQSREVYVCGSVQMMQSVIKLVRTFGVEKEFIHYEQFAL